MVAIQEETGIKEAIFNRLTQGEFKKAWDGIIGMARKALT